MVEVLLHLKNHCIETETRRVYNELVGFLLKIEDMEKERQLELLRKFLQTANFSELRKKGLDGSKEVHVLLKGNGEISIEVIG